MNIKSQKGAITVYVLIAMLVFTAIAIGIYIVSTNKQQSQLEAMEQIKKIYTANENIVEEYRKYIGGDVIPIYTAEQLSKIGTNETVYIDGKNYVFGTGKTYVLQNDITYKSDFTNIRNTINDGNIVLEKNNYTLSLTENVEIKLSNGKIVTLNSTNASQYYGEKVNYIANDNDTTNYRIFYIDFDNKYGNGENTIYLIADIDENRSSILANLDSETNRYLPKDYNTNTLVVRKMNPLWADNRGSSELSWNENEKASAYLCDATKWENYCNDKLANYAIGGPSIEMYVDSYNQTHSTDINDNNALNYKYSENTSYGYAIGTNGTYSNNGWKTNAGILESDKNSMYYTENKNFWISSPSSSSNDAVVIVNGMENSISSCVISGSNDYSLYYRPVISIKSTATLKIIE